LVSEETWLAVREVVADPSRRPARGTQTLLGGLALCHCGAPVYGGRSQKRGRIYRCRDLPGGGGGHVARLAAPVDEYITEVVIARLSRPDARDLLVDDTRPDVEGLRAQAAALRARLDQVAVEFAEDDTVSPAQLRSITERLRARLGEVEAQLADAGRLDVLGPVVGADDVRAAWQSLDLDRARAVIDVLLTVTLHRPGIGRRTFDPDTVEVRWKDGSTAG
jgi:hypothetical protein